MGPKSTLNSSEACEKYIINILACRVAVFFFPLATEQLVRKLARHILHEAWTFRRRKSRAGRLPFSPNCGSQELLQNERKMPNKVEGSLLTPGAATCPLWIVVKVGYKRDRDTIRRSRAAGSCPPDSGVCWTLGSRNRTVLLQPSCVYDIHHLQLLPALFPEVAGSTFPPPTDLWPEPFFFLPFYSSSMRLFNPRHD